MKFNCHSCGACCRQAGRIGLPHNGDYVCIHLKDNKCSIYENRPPECRVADYHKNVENLVTMNEWFELNEVHCGTLLANEIKQI